jgi:hypothetical protein
MNTYKVTLKSRPSDPKTIEAEYVTVHDETATFYDDQKNSYYVSYFFTGVESIEKITEPKHAPLPTVPPRVISKAA